MTKELKDIVNCNDEVIADFVASLQRADEMWQNEEIQFLFTNKEIAAIRCAIMFHLDFLDKGEQAQDYINFVVNLLKKIDKEVENGYTRRV